MGNRARPGRSPETLVNEATVVHERLTRQALMHHARSAVTAIAVEQPRGHLTRLGLALRLACRWREMVQAAGPGYCCVGPPRRAGLVCGGMRACGGDAGIMGERPGLGFAGLLRQLRA